MFRSFMIESPTGRIVDIGSHERVVQPSDQGKLRLFLVESPHANVRSVGLFDLFSDMRGMWRLIDHMASRGIRTVGDLDRKSTGEIFAGAKVGVAKRALFFDRLKTSRSGFLSQDYLLPPR